MPPWAYGMQPVSSDEYERLLRDREVGVQRLLRQLALGTQLTQDVQQQFAAQPGAWDTGEPAGFDSTWGARVAAPLLAADPQEQERRAEERSYVWEPEGRVESPLTSFLRRGPMGALSIGAEILETMHRKANPSADWDRLLGAARNYGIQGAERMQPDELRQVIEERRQRVRDLASGQEHNWLERTYDTAATFMGVMLSEPADAVLAAASRVPWIGDALARTDTMRDARQWLGELAERATADMPEEALALGFSGKRIATGGAGFLGYSVALGASLKMAGLAGAVPGVGTIGARVSPLGRAMARWALASWMIEGGGDAPLEERAMNIGLNSVLGGAGEAGGLLGRTVLGASIGVPVGILADDNDLRGGLVGGLVGAASVNAGAMLMRRVQAGIASRSFARWNLRNQAPPIYHESPIPEAEWEIAGSRVLPGTAPEVRALPSQTYQQSAYPVGPYLGPPEANVLGPGIPMGGGEPRALVPGSYPMGPVQIPGGPVQGPGIPTQGGTFFTPRGGGMIEVPAGGYLSGNPQPVDFNGPTTFGEVPQGYGAPMGPSPYQWGGPKTDLMPSVSRPETGSAVPGIVYHGTTHAFGEFSAQAIQPALYGPGVYFTSSPEIASGYASTKGAGRAPNVRMARLDLRRPFDIEGVVPFEEALVIADAAGIPREKLMTETQFDGTVVDRTGQPVKGSVLYHQLTHGSSLPMEQARNLANFALQQAGYDGIHYEGGRIMGTAPHDAWVVFSPEQVKSPWEGQLTSGDAATEGAQLSKHAAIVESPALASMAAQGSFGDADAGRAILASFPGQVGVLRNVGDLGETLGRLLAENPGVQVVPVTRRVGTQLYHGTRADFDEFRAMAQSWNGPKSVFFSDNPELASLYAGQQPGAQVRLAYTEAPFLPVESGQTPPPLPEGYAGYSHRESTFGYEGNELQVLDLGQIRHGLVPEHTDLLISDGRPISSSMVKQYERYGMFPGQRVLTPGGEFELVKIGPEKATVRPLSGGKGMVVPTASLLPTRASVIADSLPELWGEFKTYATARLDTQSVESGIGLLDLMGDEAATQMPMLIEEFLSAKGAGPGVREAIRYSIEHAYMQELKQLTPVEDAAHLEAVKTDYQVALEEHGMPEVEIHELAGLRGFEWKPSLFGGTLKDVHSDLEIPVGDEGAAREFLGTFDREMPDAAPGSLLPLELLENPPTYSQDGGAAPGAALSGEHADDMLEHSTDEGERMIEFLNAELEKFQGASSPWEPNISNLPVETSANRGGAMVPPPPPPPPGVRSLGYGPPEFGPRPLLPPFDAQEQFTTQLVRLSKRDFMRRVEIQDRADSFLSRVMRPVRNLTMMIDGELQRSGVSEARVHQYYAELANAHTQVVNFAHPWMDRLSTEVFRGVRSRFWRDGTFRDIASMPEAYRQDAMMKAGFKPKERQAMARYKELMRDALEEARRYYPEMMEIDDYVRHIRERAVDLPTDRRMEAWEQSPRNVVWGAEMMRRGGLDPLEKNMSVILDSYFRGLYKSIYMKQPYENMKAHAQAMRNASKQLDEAPGVGWGALADMVEEIADVRMWGVNPNTDWAVKGIQLMLDTLLKPVGIRVTNRDVMRLTHAGFSIGYQSLLGGQIAPIIRDMPQALTGGAHIGFDVFGKALKLWMNPGTREAMTKLAYESGFVQRSHGHTIDADLGAASAWGESAVQAYGGSAALRREQISRVGDFFSDKFLAPLGMKGGIQGTWADFLRLYGKQGDIARILNGVGGYMQAMEGIREYLAEVAVTSPEFYPLARQRLLKNSRVLRFQGPIQQEFLRFVDAGDYEGAAKHFGNEVANSQNRFGMNEMPIGWRRLGPVLGRAGMRWGTYNNQMLNNMVQVMGDKAIPREERLGYIARQGSIQFALGAAQLATGWNFRKMMLFGVLAIPGAALFPLLNKIQEWNARLAQGVNNRVTPQDEALIYASESSGSYGASPFSLNPARSTLNPWAGGFRSITGIAEALQTSSPVESTLRFLTTGERGDAAVDRFMREGMAPAPPVVGTGGVTPPPAVRPTPWVPDTTPPAWGGGAQY